MCRVQTRGEASWKETFSKNHRRAVSASRYGSQKIPRATQAPDCPLIMSETLVIRFYLKFPLTSVRFYLTEPKPPNKLTSTIRRSTFPLHILRNPTYEPSSHVYTHTHLHTQVRTPTFPAQEDLSCIRKTMAENEKR